jgi:hypothetical protein
VFLLSLIIAPTAFGQAVDAQGKLISPVAFANEEPILTTLVQAPTLGSSSGSSSSSNTAQWLKVEFHYGTTAILTTKYLDEIQFKVWIEGRDLQAKNAPPGGQGVAVALTGTVTYVNVPAGKDLYGVFYVHPDTLGRYSDDRGSEQFERKYDVHLEAYVGGTLMDAVNKNKEDDPLKWFQPLVPIANLVYRQDQSPFALSDSGRYPAIKLQAPAAQ